MLDIRLIREHPDAVKQRLAARGDGSVEKVDAVLHCDTQRRQAETHLQNLQAERNRKSKEIGALRGKGENTEALQAEVRGIGEEITRLNEEATALDASQRDLLLNIPNLP